MVRSTTLFLVALSISAVFAGSSPARHQRSQSHQLAARHHQSRSSRPPRSASGKTKAKRCAATSGNDTTASVTSATNSTSSSTDTGSGSGSDGGSSSDSGSSSNSTSSNPPSSSSSNDGGSSGTAPSSSNDGGSGGSSSSSSGNGGNGALPPSGTPVAGWTTVSEVSLKNIQTFTLSDNTFIMKNEMTALPHPVVQEDGAPAMHIHYDAGSYDLKTSPASIKGGFSFFTPGPAKGGSGTTPAVDLAAINACEVSFGYSAKFSSGFEWVKGGKMPGLMGGTSWDTAVTASGGNHPTDGFSTRLMFRPEGQGELYLYIPPGDNRSNLCGKTGTGQCSGPDAGNGKTYGATVGTGNFHFQAGAWTTVREVIHLNTPGQRDGWAKVYVNGASDPSISITDISFGGSGTKFYGEQMQSFLGGHDPSWANKDPQDLWLKDFSVVVNSVC